MFTGVDGAIASLIAVVDEDGAAINRSTFPLMSLRFARTRDGLARGDAVGDASGDAVKSIDAVIGASDVLGAVLDEDDAVTASVWTTTVNADDALLPVGGTRITDR